MSFYSRKQVIEVLEIDDGFLLSLESEEIIAQDAPPDATGDFSERMLERARVAQNLVRDLDVNLAGVAVIVRLREEMSQLHHRVEQLAQELSRRG
ncbi:MAG: hypothetical protein GY725_26535 [bacterium]|nr:hypothetical protein [bacterium]